jgi:hypothetical protein
MTEGRTAMTVQVCTAGCGRPARWGGYCSWHHFSTVQQRGTVDQVPVAVLTRLRRHIHALLAAGVSEAQIALDAGLNRKTIQWVSSGRAEAGTPPGYRIGAGHAARILGLTVPRTLHDGIRDAEPVPSIGTVRRLRALVAAGHPATAIAHCLELPLDVVDHLLGGAAATVTAGVARAAAALFGGLQMTPGASEQARRIGKSRGWAPPLAWDEDLLDETTARPDFGSRKRAGFVEVYSEFRMLGFTDLRIAERMGVQPGSLLRQMIRYGLTPSPELVNTASHLKHRAAKKAS